MRLNQPPFGLAQRPLGAGGYGERIVAGLAVNDNALLLAGAVPAALLAIIIVSGFGVAEWWLVPRGLATVGFSK